MNERSWSVGEIDEEIYSHFLMTSTAGTVFHDLEWLRIIREGFGVGIRLVGFWQHGTLRGVCPIESRRPCGFRISGSPLPRLFTPYQGILWDPEVGMEERLISICCLERYLQSSYLRMQWEPRGTDDDFSEPFEMAYTPTLDLRVGEEGLFKGMKSETRNHVRQAARRGVQVRFVQEDGNWVDDYLRLSVATYDRQGLKSPMREGFLRAIFRRRNGSDGDVSGRGTSAEPSRFGAVAVLALLDEKIVGASLVIHGRNTAYYLDNVSLREYQRYRANNAMMWEIIRWAIDHGLARYDLVGANHPSIAAFKFGFGAVRESFPVYVSSSRIGRIVYGASRFARLIRQTMLRR